MQGEQGQFRKFEGHGEKLRQHKENGLPCIGRSFHLTEYKERGYFTREDWWLLPLEHSMIF
jgi:hypothetical protein